MLSNSLLTNARSAAGFFLNSSRRLSSVDRMLSLLSSTSLLGEATRTDETASGAACTGAMPGTLASSRSEEHTSQLESLIHLSYAFFLFKKYKISHIYHMT